ncbi:P-loop NTPase fold protein [Vibrio sp. 2art]|uniref:KAP family P-loop NTPase fold protein n=1 Tax=Vibrio sp. 2art TaxID=2998832 RepID=UPI0022CD67BE|nr:P-loop NTPase fold protein [Vibrio sp. 2art]MDA0115286.1 P-loop NTPase fold protein [Vibrio sp. 2art]
MTTKTHAKHYEKWAKKYNWETCNADREQYGKFLMSIITTDSQGSVFNLNGSWGTGKTELLKRLYVEASERKHPVVYIDVWESDFLKDPLTAISYELLTQLSFIFEENKENFKKDTKDAFIKLASGIEKVVRIGKPITELASIATGDSMETKGLAHFSELLSMAKDNLPNGLTALDRNSQLIEMLQKNQQLTDGMSEVRTQISIISEILENVYDLKIPIIILIDELDRCRPDYAVKVLETIKHFFSVKGCTFLIATDTEELKHSIKAIYGSGFSADNYLNRFFTNRISLEKPSVYSYLKSKNVNFSAYNKDEGFCLCPYFSNDNHFYLSFLSALFSHPKVSLRDVDQITAKITQALNYCEEYKPKGDGHINFVALSFGVFYNHLNQCLFDKYSDAKVNENLKIEVNGRSINVNTILEVFMALVFERETNKTRRGSTTSTHGQVVVALESMCTSNTDIQREFLRIFGLGEAIENAISDYNDSRPNYWLWSDYKKIVNLSGCIN